MAAALEDDLTCPLCSDLYQDPVLLSCGHTLCRRCRFGYQCPVCHQTVRQDAVSNLVLRNTCLTFRTERERQRRDREQETDEGPTCVQHGERMRFFCKDDQIVICLKCRKHHHTMHKVQPLTHAVQQRKDEIKTALQPTVKALESLRNRESKVIQHIQCQAKQTEQQIIEEFKTLFQFLREEEEARKTAVREEEQKKKETLEKRIKGQTQTLSNRVMGVEEELQNDDITFIKNFYSILNMTAGQVRTADTELDSTCLIDVAKHLGNLRYKVWEKMKVHCPLYPVVIDPNTAPPKVSVSGDLTSLSQSVRRIYSLSPILKRTDLKVFGSVAQNSNVNCWEVDVGLNNRWTIGVGRLEENRTGMAWFHHPNISWGLTRQNDVFFTEGFGGSSFTLSRKPRIVQVKLERQGDINNPKWKLTFLDASNSRVIACGHNLPNVYGLLPFFVSNENETPLRIVPSKITIKIEEELSFLARNAEIILGGLVIVFCFILFVVVLTLKLKT